MVLKHRHTLVLSLLMAGVYPPNSYAQQSPSQVLIDRARALDAQGRHDIAADDWRKVLLIEPRQVDGLEALVRYYRGTGQSARAQQYETMLRSLRPNDAALTTDGGATGNNSDAMLREASRLAAAHRYEESVALYQQAFGSTQPPDNWAVAYYQTEAAIPADRNHGIAGLRGLVQKYPANPSYQLALAQTLTYSPATRVEGIHMLADFHSSATQNEEARAAWKQAILWNLGAPGATEIGKQYLDRYPDAELSAKLAAATQHAAPTKQNSPLEGEGYKALAAGDFDEATQRFTVLAGLPGHASQGEAGLAYVSMKRKDFAGAVSHFERARQAGDRTVALENALEEARYWSAMSEGNAASEARDEDRAAAEFERAREVNAARPEANEALGGSLLADKDSQRAEAVFAQELKSNPHRPEAWIGWMNAALENGKAANLLAAQRDIVPEVRAALARRPDYLALLATAELATGNAAAANRLLDRIHQLSVSNPTQSSAEQVRAAGLLLASGYNDQAAQLCINAIKADRENADAWQTLVQAQHAAGRDDVAVRVATQMPKSVDAVAMQNADFLLALAAVYQGQKRFTPAATLLDRAEKLGTLSGRNLYTLRLQAASLAMARGDTHGAYDLYRSLAQQAPDKPDAWSGMVNALHAAKHDPEALATIEELPPPVMTRLRQDPAFLQTAAFIYSENNKPREAMLCLSAVTRHYTQAHQPIPFAVDTEYAWLLLNANKDADLAAVLERISGDQHLTAEQTLAVQQIWAAWSSRRAEAEYQRGDPKRAVAILQVAVRTYPERAELRAALANMYVRTGNANVALKMYQQMDWDHASVEQFQGGIDAAIAAHSNRYAEYWLNLGLEQHPNDVVLLREGARLEEGRGDRKRAERYLQAAIDGGAPHKETDGSLLSELAAPSNAAGFGNREARTAAAEEDVSPQGQLARMLGGAPASGRSDAADSRSGRSALTTEVAREQPVFKPLAFIQPRGGESDSSQSQPDDSFLPNAQGSAALGAPVSGKQHVAASAAWPGEDASAFNPSGPTAVPESQPGTFLDAASDVPANRPARDTDILADLGMAKSDRATTLSAGGSSSATTVASSAPTLESILNGNEASPVATSFTDGLAPDSAPHSSSSSNADPLVAPSIEAILGTAPVVSTAQQKAADELAALENRYSPWLGTGSVVETHSGTPGFDQLHHYEAEIEGSTVVGGAARVTFVSRPVLLQSGVPTATSNYRLGSGSALPTTSQFSSGLGAEVQLATRSLQLAIGTSPSGFLVTNAIGSIAIRPLQGHFTFLAYRSAVKDSLLSYAGMKDANTGEVWGGVVADGGSLMFNSGGADSGFYASVDGQRLTGKNVEDNSRLLGNAGAYFLVYSGPYGRLKVGANLTAMHYALNERYFTIGQGGYFSPNAFLMMNAPVTWEGRTMHQTSYLVTGSIGAQNIQQGQAISGSLIAGNGVETVTGASYDLQARVVHSMTAHWALEGFAGTNNAREYSDRTAGFTLRYLKNPQSSDAGPSGFLDQTQIRPLQQP